MTEQNKIINIKEELERVETSLAAADLLHANEYVNDAVSRLYYYLFHGVRALLLSKGIEPKSHERALQMFSLHFVKTKIFDTYNSHIFARLIKYRSVADCSASYVFTPDDYSEFRNDAQKVFDNIINYLKKGTSEICQPENKS